MAELLNEEALIDRALEYINSESFKVLHVDKNRLRSGEPCMSVITPVARLGVIGTVELGHARGGGTCYMEDYGRELALWEGGPSCYIESRCNHQIQRGQVEWVDAEVLRSSGAWAIAYDRFNADGPEGLVR